jgi:hypothetical protein
METTVQEPPAQPAVTKWLPPTLKPSSREIRVVEDHSSLAHLFDTARFEHMHRIATGMAAASLIPEHLWKDKTGALSPEQVRANCFLVVNQAVRWNIDPFALAPESYVVGGKLAYQGKVIAAIINARAPIKERLKYTFTGAKGTDAFAITVSATFQGEDEPRTITLSVGEAKTSNDMWRKDPEQKLVYSGSIKWARRFCPDIVLGVVTEDDVIDITPAPAVEKIVIPPRAKKSVSGGNHEVSATPGPESPVSDIRTTPQSPAPASATTAPYTAAYERQKAESDARAVIEADPAGAMVRLAALDQITTDELGAALRKLGIRIPRDFTGPDCMTEAELHKALDPAKWEMIRQAVLISRQRGDA